MPTFPNRRERKAMETRGALRDAAWRLIRERGFEKTTVRDIADAADVALRTFFRHFPTKEAVLFDPERDLGPALLAAFDARPAREPVLASIVHALSGVLTVGDAERERWLWRAELARKHPGIAAYSRQFHQRKIDELAGLIAGRLGADSDMRAQLVARATAAVVDVAVMQWLAPGNKREISELIESAYQQLEEILHESRSHLRLLRRGAPKRRNAS